MPTATPPIPVSQSSADRSLRAVVWLVLLALIARVAYLVWFCRYELVEDEAHYWLWSRHLDWSYYSKGPGVAWAIRASTAIFGDAEWAVRLPTAIASAIGALAIGTLARDLAMDAHDRAAGAAVGGMDQRRDWASPARIGFLAALAYTLAPALQGTAILMTIDGPYVACWSVACWACWRAMRSSGSPSFWLLVGAAIGIGFLFKYTILLLIPGLLVFAMLSSRRNTDRAKGRAGAAMGRVCIALGLLLVLAGIAPVLYWNAQKDWPTYKHLLGHLGMAGGDMPVARAADGGSKWSPWWLPELIGQQIGLIGPWLFLAFFSLWVPRLSEPGSASLPHDPRRTARFFLFCSAAPILVFYAIVSLITEPEGNWPMAAYATLLPLAAWIGADALAARSALRSRGELVPGALTLRVRFWRIGLTYAILAAVFIHATDRIADVALQLDKQPWFHDRYHRMLGRDLSKPDTVMRDPAGRLRGSREMAAHVSELLTVLRDETQREPFVIAQHYGRASQLAYYLRGTSRPWTEVLCAMAHTGGRESQFDYWPQTKLNRPDLLGRPAVIITSMQPYMTETWRKMFVEVAPIPGQRLRGEGKSDRSAMVGLGWKGRPGSAPQPVSPAPASTQPLSPIPSSPTP